MHVEANIPCKYRGYLDPEMHNMEFQCCNEGSVYRSHQSKSHIGTSDNMWRAYDTTFHRRVQDSRSPACVGQDTVVEHAPVAQSDLAKAGQQRSGMILSPVPPCSDAS